MARNTPNGVFKALWRGLCVLGLVLMSVRVWGQGADIFDFFAEEAQVITASRKPQPIQQSPATVYVVTGEEIRASGAQTFWDALRGVPGVDVMNTRAFHGEVSIRGLTRPLNNRVLVLLDGKTVLNGFFDFVAWEEIPVTLAEVDRIEVVEGPASALYGANAISGVVNIITKSPEQLAGGEAGYALGERQTHLGHFVYGGRAGQATYKMGVGWRSANRFEDADLQSSDVFKVHGLVERTFQNGTEVRVSGGFSAHDVQMVAAGGVGTFFNDGKSGFVRGDFQFGDTRVRGFWNRGRGVFRNFESLNEPDTDYDTHDLTVEHLVDLPGNTLVVGGGYRRNTMTSLIFDPDRVSQDMWAVFFEDVWQATGVLRAVVSGRADYHPLAGWMFSPRGSVLFSPSAQQVVRVTGGTSFRNPTIAENHLLFELQTPNSGTLLPNPPFETIDVRFEGNRGLEPERMLFFEGAHSGRFGRIKTSAAVFYYRVQDLIAGTVQDIQVRPGGIRVTSSFENRSQTRAWGGEAGVEASVSRRVTASANYAYQTFSGSPDPLAAVNGGPAHKLNGRVRFADRGLSLSLSAHWVGQTVWEVDQFLDSIPTELEGYLLLNARLGYAFSGRLSGFEVGLSAFNLADHTHFQILPAQSATVSGQNGEVIRRRLTAAFSFRF